MKTKRKQKTAVWFLSKLLNAVIFINVLFFTVMGLTDIGQDSFGVGLGFGVGIPLLVLFIYRLRRQNAQAAQAASAPVAPEKAPVDYVVICERCGAPGRGEVCEYCGGPLPRAGNDARKRR